MKRASFLLAVGSIALGASSFAMAGNIYTWIDDDGGVHFEDRPVENVAVELVAIDSRATDNAAVSAQTQARLEAKAAADKIKSEAPPEMTRQERNAEIEKRQQQCQSYRAQLDEYVRARALYEEGADGERIYQDEAQRQATISRVQGQINEYCGA